MKKLTITFTALLMAIGALWAGDPYLGQICGDYSLAVNSQGEAYSWGFNNLGQLGDNSTTDSPVPVEVVRSGVLSGKIIIAIAGGIQHSVALDSDGKAYSWGSDGYGQLGSTISGWSAVPVEVYTAGVLSGKTLTAIATGGHHTVALDSDGKVYTWGYNNYGQLGNNSTTSASLPIAVDVSGVLSGKTITAISAGSYHTVVMDSDGKVYAWGWNGNGQLGNNSTTDSHVPIAVDVSGVLSGKTMTAVSGGVYHTVALDSDGKVYAWGYNGMGQLGDNSTTDSHIPVAVDVSGVLSGKTMTAVSGGDYHTVALDSDGKVYAWGWNGNGQLGNNSTIDSHVPIAVDVSGVLSGKTMTAVSGGVYNTVVLDSDGKVYAWGNNGKGQLGDNSMIESHVPVQVVNSDDSEFVLLISPYLGQLNGNHSVAINSQGETYSWGYNNAGQLGNNSTTDSHVPVEVVTSGVLLGKKIRTIAGGNQHTVALDSDGKAYSWGSDGYGQLGSTISGWSAVPVEVYTAGVLSGKTLTAIATGDHHAVALDSDGKVYTWGYNNFGQLGNNSTTSASLPIAVDVSGVLSGKTITAIAAGSYHTVAIDSDGKLYTWGWNNAGQLGDNSTTDSHVPVAVDGSGVLSGKTMTTIAGGTYHTAAMDSDGKVYAWGYNEYGQLGNNSTTDSHVPVAVDVSGVLSGKTITAIAAGSYHTAAMDSDGKVYAWGYNEYGQLGNNSTTESHVPVAVDVSGVLSGKTMTAIAVGINHTAAMDSDGKVYAWGYNGYGQLGDNSTTQSLVPVQVVNSDNSDFALPVTLVSFTANSQNGTVILTWSTGSEAENQGYVLERRVSDEDAWTEIVSYLDNDALIGHGSTTETHDYCFVDNTVQSGVTYSYRLGDVDYNSNIIWHDEIAITIEAEDVDVPIAFGLQKAYPNPFNPEITINYGLTENAYTTLLIYNMRGQLVETLQSANISAGNHNVIWQPINVGTGMYIVQLRSGNNTNMQKIVYVK